MLKYIDVNEKSYEEMMKDGLDYVSLLSPEWTNYNPSEPGVTIIENLALFETLAQNKINSIPDSAIAGLLKIAGFMPYKGRPARLLLMPKGHTGPFIVPKNERFTVDDMVFESNREILAGYGKIRYVAGVIDGKLKDFSKACDPQVKIPLRVFGNKPVSGNMVLFFFTALPENGDEIILYLVNDNNVRRNSFEKNSDLFATISFEVYTESGFVEISGRDMTNGFMSDGELKMRIPHGVQPALYTVSGYEGYCIRGVLKECSYDVPPGIINISDPLFEVFQMDTRSFIISGNRAGSIEIDRFFHENFFITVFAKEEKTGQYRRYEPYTGRSFSGRFYTVEDNGGQLLTYNFDKMRFGYGPIKSRGAVRVLCYKRDIMRNYRLGIVAGYDNESFELPVNNVVVENFSVLAKREDGAGDYFYTFVRPEFKEDGAFCYHLLEDSGRIIIDDAGDFVGAELYMGAAAVFAGEAGNINAGIVLKGEVFPDNVYFTNPAPGTGGCALESLESVRRRFTNDIYTPYSAVTAADYEKLVLNTPGLCIKKAKAYVDRDKNLVKVAVMPDLPAENGYPVLSDDYRRRIETLLEGRRLLTTRVEVVSPEYVQVAVRASVCVKGRSEYVEENVTTALKQILDYTRTDKEFGELLKFDEVFKTIESVPEVEFVYSLSIRPVNPKFSEMSDLDVAIKENVLIVPGSIHLELIKNM